MVRLLMGTELRDPSLEGWAGKHQGEGLSGESLEMG